MAWILVAWSTPLSGQEVPILAHDAERVQDAREIGQPASLRVAPDGRLYMSDPAGRRLLIFSPEGTPEDTIRLETISDGPFPRYFGWHGDGVWATDWFSSELVFFDERWEVVERIDPLLPSQAGIIRALRLSGVAADGSLLVETTAPLEALARGDPGGIVDPSGVGGPSTGGVSELPVWRVAREGGSVDTLVNLSTRHSAVAFYLPAEGQAGQVRQGWRSAAPQPFRDDPLWAVGPSGRNVVILDRRASEGQGAPSYEVRRVNAGGDTLSTVSYAYFPDRIPENWIESEVRRIAERSDGTPGTLALIREGLFLPAYLPPVSHVVVGHGGYVWAGQGTAPGTSTRRWDVLAPDGTRLGAVRLPSDIRVQAIEGLTGWGVEESGDGSHLWRIRIREDG